ncbi:MAG: hypothetical protein WAV31_01345 [Candidatus Moraniibacteriota bacterium]
MSNIKYIQILRDAWKIVWKNRFLWWFGFFILLFIITSPGYSPQINSEPTKEWRDFSEQIHLQEFIENHSKLLIFLGITLIITFLLSTLLLFLSKGAIIKSTQRILKKEPASFLSAWKDGRKYFKNNAYIILFSSLALFFCMFVLIAPVMTLFSVKAYSSAIPLAILAFLICASLIMLYKFIQTYACFYATLADLKPWLAIENAYALFKKNILSSLIMSLIFIPISLLYLLVAMALLLLLMFISVIIGLIILFVFKESALFIAIIIFVMSIIAIILLFSVFIVFSQVAWILFFYRIATPKIKKVVVETIKKLASEEIIENSNATDVIKTIDTKK